MKCEQCKVNPATIQMNVSFNQHKQQLTLCADCYHKITQSMNTTGGMNPMNQFSSFDDFFKQMMNNGMNSGFSGQQQSQQAQQQGGGRGRGGGFLDQFGRNISQAAKTGLIDPVIGREEEINRVIEILNRRNKNNPVLIGEPGVGKTAIAEGLALKIAEGTVPSKLLSKEVYLLDVASLVADTGIRGQFEERMKQLIAELQKRKNIILFIDEIHQIVGAGSAEGSMDAGNILKPALARGELQLVGATTLKEYRKIEKDAALERRFQPVIVNEPTPEKAFEILKGLASKYEQYHEVTFSEDVLKACVTLSHRYIQDRFLPDKAIDLMDEAGSKINLLHSGNDTSSIEERLEEISKEKEQAAMNENYELAAKLRQEELQLEAKLNENEGKEKAAVTLEDIQSIVEQKTGIPVKKLQEDEQAKMKDLAKNLSQKVIGQQEAVEKVSKAIRRSRAGLKAKNRPIGSFLFVGPTGVGKTELTKSLAEELFGDKEAMIRLDMSEYMEKHAVSKLIGSPPGYVGHDEAGQLTEMVRRKPYSIILLDEIEKAHPDVQHMFLQILEDGRLTDSQGRTVSFKDTVIIMTSNAGSGVKQTKKLGFTNEIAEVQKETNILDAIGSYFKPEFLNRFDSIVQFQSLKEDDLVQIVELMLADLKENLVDQGITIEFTDEAKKKIAELGYHPAFGARPLRRVIQEKVEDAVADVLLDQEENKALKVDVRENELVVE
ncbi:ATP-dependent Clp protease ATP-binding subunit [Fictibacillus enclensis]|uniref:ATP-dependent Clp protease ATP-binding subunit n=1 Tax=Fictibacillus enclensis TaxID=1017270 RepID=A0A0V8JB87_9BACL|nr:ATP-dependent Clp protease ATP-binding subunit [Fictibacillus enclensis]KSU84209.1 ATP-dependent Clp protease ATP-binding subunit [Fictibacillus enclensis]MDM5197825.1 ATP-dependent Clp protease ATP-binding subunit [Fictibacillus enclensis]SCB75061.1 ATP-dependent Clp protease ATP-binding subunit ClpE [Fictibacillus enclensis]